MSRQQSGLQIYALIVYSMFVKIKWYIIYMYLVLRKQLLSFKEDCVKNKIFHIQDLCLRTPGTNLLYKKCVQK